MLLEGGTKQQQYGMPAYVDIYILTISLSLFKLDLSQFFL